MALDEHDKRVREQNAVEKSDKQKKKYFEKVEQQGHDAMEKIEEKGQRDREAQEEADYQADITAAARAQAAANNVGTIPVPSNIEATESIQNDEQKAQIEQEKATGSNKYADMPQS